MEKRGIMEKNRTALRSSVLLAKLSVEIGSATYRTASTAIGNISTVWGCEEIL